jgi:periplasmic copper chaperone A
VLGVAALPVAFLAAAASAHVSVSADDPTQGGFAKITFRVPNETDSTNTTRVAVFFPLTQPLASVSVQQLPGWSYQVKTHHLDKPISSDDGTVTEAVSEVVWTADSPASAIKPGEFEEFDVAAGPLPESPTMVFKALQTYSDGEIVRWIEEPSSGAEAEHPAPVLKLAASAPTNSGTSVTSGSSGSGSGSSGGNGPAVGLAIAGLVLGLAGLVLGALAYRKATSRAS